MIRKPVLVLLAVLLTGIVEVTAFSASLSPALKAKLAAVPDTADVGVVIVAFNTRSGLDNSHLAALQSVGISSGRTLPNLGMVAVVASAGQVKALAANPAVRSIWSNDRLKYFINQARMLTGVDRVRVDPAFTRLNGGLPVSGKGNFSVVINDSGIDATHDDLKLGSHVIQNVQVLLPDTVDLVTGGFTPLLVVENLPNNDTTGHGTHCAGIVGGTGQDSGGLYAGVAPGAKLVGVGSGATLLILNALAGFEYSLANQPVYNIRVISNSWGPLGGGGDFDPSDPVNIASKTAHDRNIIVVFAAGNDGPGKSTLSTYAKAPWVIGVAAGTKEGGLASFSSRGVPKDERCDPSQSGCDPNVVGYNFPTITAPGTGREFNSAAEQAKFTTDIVSTRSKTNLFANGTASAAAIGNDAELAPAYIPFYTEISGTSMATPFIAGTAALMLSVDPTLTPDDVKQILTQTATRMPGFQDFEMGAGYVNVYAAVDKVFNRSKNFGTFLNPAFNQAIQKSQPANQQFSINYSPTTGGPTSANAHGFTVAQDMDVLDAFVAVGDVNSQASGFGNTVYMELTDPKGTTYDSLVMIPALTSPTLEVKVNNPLPGPWTLEIIGYFGQVAAPDQCDATIVQQRFTLSPVPSDISGNSAEADITSALKMRRMDTFSDGSFRPDSAVTREDFARTLSLNTPLRQSLAASPIFTDVSADLEPIAEAVSARGSTLRDWNFVPQGMITTTGSSFNPAGTVTRLDLAVALVRALGLDAEARAKANTAVTSGGTELTDDSKIPASLRGYVQIAIDKGLLEVYPASVQQIAPGQFQALPGPRVEPTTVVTRAALAGRINRFSDLFVAGN